MFFLLSFSFYIGWNFLWKTPGFLLYSSSYECISLWITHVVDVFILVMNVYKNDLWMFYTVFTQNIGSFTARISTGYLMENDKYLCKIRH